MIEYSELCYAIEAYRHTNGLSNVSRLALHHRVREGMGLASAQDRPVMQVQPHYPEQAQVEEDLGESGTEEHYDSEGLAFAEEDAAYFDQALDNLEEFPAEDDDPEKHQEYPSTGS